MPSILKSNKLNINMMKKFLAVLLVMVFHLIDANAQCDEFPIPETNKYSVATKSFWSNWYVQAGVNVAIQNPYGTDFFTENWHDGRTYGLELAVGKWFTPGFGVAVKGLWNNGLLYHAFRNTDHLADYTPNCEMGGFYSFVLEPRFNIVNMIGGYSETRTWNLILITRAGWLHRYDNTADGPLIGAGFGSTWKLSPRCNVYVEALYNCAAKNYWGFTSADSDDRWDVWNGFVNASVGLQFDLGKKENLGWAKAVKLEDYEALADEACDKLAKLRKQLKDEQDENARLRDLLAKQPKKPAAAAGSVMASIAVSVFFDLNSSEIRSQKDHINIEAIAEAAKKSGCKILISGSADSDTGSSVWNQKLSESRCNSVADELMKLGVERSNIEIRAKGGVHEIDPYVLNRRVVLELK